MTPEKNRPRRWGKIVSKTLLVVVAVAFVSPFVWMLFSALKPSNQVLSTGAALLGDAVRWDNFAEAFSS
ncbi:MAG: carbohydrate ABC transporter permease, partial [Arachnia propionica]